MVIYEGPSQIDGSPIVVILTGVKNKSHNSKTGEMPQAWILRSDVHPTEALRTGEDVSICGDCPHRPKELGDKALSKSSRTCYVTVMGPNAIYKKYSNGDYPIVNPLELGSKLQGQKVRLGAYGDPAAVPIQVWDELLSLCESTGYTHQWRTCDEGYANYCMASCDNALDVMQATIKGYRAFYVQNVSDFANADKFVDNVKLSFCPASKEMGKVTTCSKCMACSGNRLGRKSNITILMH